VPLQDGLLVNGHESLILILERPLRSISLWPCHLQSLSLAYLDSGVKPAHDP
jgi:hypothetical protein